MSRSSGLIMKLLVHPVPRGFIGYHNLASFCLAPGAYEVGRGSTNLNNYYDVSLKKARASRYCSNSHRFAFEQLDLTDRDAMAKAVPPREAIRAGGTPRGAGRGPGTRSNPPAHLTSTAT